MVCTYSGIVFYMTVLYLAVYFYCLVDLYFIIICCLQCTGWLTKVSCFIIAITLPGANQISYFLLGVHSM